MAKKQGKSQLYSDKNRPNVDKNRPNVDKKGRKNNQKHNAPAEKRGVRGTPRSDSTKTATRKAKKKGEAAP